MQVVQVTCLVKYSNCVVDVLSCFAKVCFTSLLFLIIAMFKICFVFRQSDNSTSPAALIVHNLYCTDNIRMARNRLCRCRHQLSWSHENNRCMYVTVFVFSFESMAHDGRSWLILVFTVVNPVIILDFGSFN